MDLTLGNTDIGNIHENLFLTNIGLEPGHIGGHHSEFGLRQVISRAVGWAHDVEGDGPIERKKRET